MKRKVQSASKRKPKTRVVGDAPRSGDVANVSQISLRRKPPKAA